MKLNVIYMVNVTLLSTCTHDAVGGALLARLSVGVGMWARLGAQCPGCRRSWEAWSDPVPGVGGAGGVVDPVPGVGGAGRLGLTLSRA